jgi:hypothetical protein
MTLTERDSTMDAEQGAEALDETVVVGNSADVDRDAADELDSLGN